MDTTRSIFRWFVLIALYLSLARNVQSQDIDREPGSLIPDPPFTTYKTGLEKIDAAIFRSLPEMGRFRGFLPERVDLSANFPRPGNQGALGSCASWAVGYAARGYYTWVAGRRKFLPENLVSPNYLYNMARTASCESDPGTSLAANVNVLQSGALSMKDYPYRPVCEAISPEVRGRASDFQVSGLSRIALHQIDDIRGQLAKSVPVVLSIKVTNNFQAIRGARTFENDADLEKPGKSDFHAVVAVGYDDRRQAIRIINSWGRGWGDGGYGWLGYELASKMIQEAIVLSVTDFNPGPLLEPVSNPSVDQMIAQVNSRACGKVIRQDVGDVVTISGVVGSLDDIRKLEEFAQTRPNVRTDHLVLAPWPQCELHQVLNTALGEADRPDIQLLAGDALIAGKGLEFTVRAPQHFSYLYVSYVQADQSIAHLVQPLGTVAGQTAPGQVLSFGGGKNGQQTFTISAPFGREAIFVIASRSPLFGQPLPANQTAREYLSGLRKALIYRPKQEAPPRIIAASVIEFKTEDKK